MDAVRREQLIASATTGTPSHEQRARKLDWSARLGGTGYAKTPTTLAEVARRLPETHKQARKARAAEAKARSSETLRSAGFEAINGLCNDGPAGRSGTGFSPAGPDSLPERGFTPRLAASAGAE